MTWSNCSAGPREGEIDGAFTRAEALFRAGDVRAAEQGLRALLDQQPTHAPALNLLAIIAGRAGRDVECAALLERAVDSATGEQAAASALLLASAYERAGRLDAAEAACRRAVAAAPKLTHARLRLAMLLRRGGETASVIEVLKGAMANDPASAAAHGMLASALFEAGDLAAAADGAARAVALDPANLAFIANLAVIRNAQGAHEEAERLCRSALHRGEDAGLLNTLGIALKEQARLEEAAACLQRASDRRPGSVEALYNLAAVRKDQGRTDDAIALLRQVIAQEPDLAAARFALCTAHLPPIYADEAELTRRRADYAEALEALVAHAERTGPGRLAAGVGAAQPFHLAYQGLNDVALQRRHGALVCRVMAEACPPTVLAGPAKCGERIRLGVVCGFIRDHSVWRAPTRGWVEGLDRTRFELIGYHTGAVQDAETLRARDLFDRFDQGPLPFDAWRGRIGEDRPHALLYPEIGMDPMAARLAALRLAPTQHVSWGHPSTSGYPTIDYFLSSNAMEPEDAETHYAERLVRLPNLSAPLMLKRVEGSAPERASFGLCEGVVVYWSGQSLPKYLPQHDWVFAAIAKEVPNSQFVFIEFPGAPSTTQRFKDRLSRAFSAWGLDAEAFCAFLPRLSPKTFLSAMGCADVVLDSIGWSGCNTLLDAVSHSLPIVTAPGRTMRSRHGAAILRQLRLEDLICGSPSAYVAMATRLAEAGFRAQMAEVLERNVGALADTSGIGALQEHLIASARSPHSLDPAPAPLQPDR